ncbi:MAG: ABC transporter ATP-binding protein [Candidatus Krumholzibacteriota bacterium]|nr:ABC transporter ATP-binding protein [Candidatus Krumholzibacteriota bacterium]
MTGSTSEGTTARGADASLLHVADLRVGFPHGDGHLAAVDGVSLDLPPGGTLCLVGESGCGKTLTALAIMGLLPRAARLLGGSLRLGGRELATLPERERRRLRGIEMAMIFQEPMTSLNPVLHVGLQITEALRRRGRLGRREARERAASLLAEVGVPEPAARLGSYPHELSGGLRQRVMIAIALAGDPDLLVADEPTTALDVTVQAQVLAKLRELRERRGLALLLITHDLGVVAQAAGRVLVMYAGQVVEAAPVVDLFAAPRHPYTRGLLASLPRPDRPPRALAAIPGTVPRPGLWPAGCRFRDRCPLAEDACGAAQALRDLGGGRALRCWKEAP